jgi:nucleotide-binding universal stress UspA family protein
MGVRKIFWLLDPFEKPIDASEAGAWALGLSKKLGAPIQPVHVLSGGALGLSPEIHAAWLMQVAIQAEERLQRIVDRLGVEHVLPPIVLSEIYRSRSEAVVALLEFARESDAEVLVLQRLSRARKTGKIGGFAETLLLKSEIPVLVVGRHHVRGAASKTPATRVPKKILLAVDLEGDALPLVSQVGDWAKRVGASVHLFHSAAQFPVAGYRPTADIFPGDWSGPVAPMTMSAWKGDLEARRRELERLKKTLERRGVRCTMELDSASTRAAEGILRSQRKNRADWIAVSGKSSRWSALILGSVSRIVAREAGCPVWVVRAPLEKRQQARPERRRKAAA